MGAGAPSASLILLFAFRWRFPTLFSLPNQCFGHCEQCSKVDELVSEKKSQLLRGLNFGLPRIFTLHVLSFK